MEKVYKIKGLDCAHCAQKLENLINNVDGVTSAKLAFVLQKLKINFDDEKFEEAIDKVMQIIEDFGSGELTVKQL